MRSILLIFTLSLLIPLKSIYAQDDITMVASSKSFNVMLLLNSIPELGKEVGIRSSFYKHESTTQACRLCP